MPGLSPRFAGDDDPGTVHIAALIDEEVVGCVTFLKSTIEDRPAWQMRGMAVDTARQGRGIGRHLLDQARAILAAADPRRLWWCNARTSAVPFYRALGWETVSEEFEIPSVGPHYRMIYNA
ncbi:MAG TPA: GNAT family N-acetyltransferase [Candidatus Ozemobacteraceae bacterium]|nr:GNAT family N-acetyltransferase [Candidatus Ozemobacteraceae bacterium]